MYSTRTARHVAAAPDAVYRALTDRDAVAAWRVPDGMTAEIHEFDARVGGRFRVSLHYDSADAEGKSAAHTDTYAGYFVDLVPDQEVVEEIAFESDDPALQSVMTMTAVLMADGTGTEIVLEHQDIPDAIPRADNELGTRMALDKLAAYVERA